MAIFVANMTVIGASSLPKLLALVVQYLIIEVDKGIGISICIGGAVWLVYQ